MRNLSAAASVERSCLFLSRGFVEKFLENQREAIMADRIIGKLTGLWLNRV